MPRPATVAEYLASRAQMIDSHGRQLVLEYCARCRHEHFTVEPHADEAPCPDCGSKTSRCRRGSGHDAAAWHRRRRDVFEALCVEREAAGLAQVAAWPETA